MSLAIALCRRSSPAIEGLHFGCNPGQSGSNPGRRRLRWWGNDTRLRASGRVAGTAPGIFTANGSGTGPGAILNSDGTPNGPANSAPRGGYVVLYTTGAGQTNPPGVSGKVTTVAAGLPITPVPIAPIEVRINGQTAPVVFAGEAPGLVSGIVQLNVQIPTTVSPGNVPIQVIMGGVSSLPGVTVSVR